MNLEYTLAQLRKDNPDARITQSYLRSEVVLGTTQAVAFPILVNQAVVSSKEVRLAIGDAFCVTAMTVKLYKSLDTAAPLTAANVGKAIDYSYPNAAVFSGSGESAALENIYNSYLQVIIQKAVIYSAYPTWKFRRVNQSQFGATSAAATPIAASAAASPVTAFTIPAEEQAGVNNGLVGLVPTINLIGSWAMNFTLQLPSAPNMAGTASVNVAALILDGFLLQNANQYNFSTNQASS